jgi:hypothetical protein
MEQLWSSLQQQCEGLHSGTRHTAVTLLAEAGCAEPAALEAMVWAQHHPPQRQAYTTRLLSLCTNLYCFPPLQTLAAADIWHYDHAQLRGHVLSPAEQAQAAARQLEDTLRDTTIPFDMSPYAPLDICRKCKQPTLKAYFQTCRSGDEGAVQVIKCINPTCL